jgi:predicted nucleic acid-binding protein
LSGVLLDTDIIIEVLRRRDEGILLRWQQLGARSDRVFYTPVTAAELWQGMRPREEETVLELLAVMTCLPITFEMGRMAGNYLQRFGPSHSLELGDALIAGAAAVHGCALWTRNRKHYPMKDIELF